MSKSFWLVEGHEGCVVPKDGNCHKLKHIGHPDIKMAAEAALPACRCSNCPSFQDTYVKDPMNFGFQKNSQKIVKSLLFVPATKKRGKRLRKHALPEL